MLFSEKCADLDGKSYYACCNSSRHSLFAKVPLLGESTKGKQNAVDCKSGRKRHTSNTCHRVPNIATFFRNSLHVEKLFFCPKHFLNLTDPSPSGPARRFAEPDLGLICLYDQSQTFSF